jgi:meso-butanediol dehydrogenase/(S,S)-butanediol dehydrogenase/diacetyl reductase
VTEPSGNALAPVAIVTGAGGGIGKASALALIDRGWRVVAADVVADRLAWTGQGPGSVPCVADVATAEGNNAIVEEAMRTYGCINGIVLNAAVDRSGTIDELPMDDFDFLVSVNLRGVVLGLKAAVPVLRKGGRGGAIVLTSSLHGLSGDAGTWAYSATKHGIIGLARALSRELGPDGIRVNVVAPGPIRQTSLSAGIESANPERFDRVRRAIPLGRWGDAEDVAGAIAFLLGHDSAFVNGAVLTVDGGVDAGSGLHFPIFNS